MTLLASLRRDPDIAAPNWLSEAAAGSFEKHDVFLTECGMHPDQLAGLPDAAELRPDGPVDSRCPKAVRALRVCKAPEALAGHLLELPHLAPSNGLTRGSDCKPHARSCSFSAGVFVRGGVVGLRRTCAEYPASQDLIREAKPGVAFTSFSVNQNIETLPHVDSHNAAREPNLILALNRFRRGGVWVEVQGGPTAIYHKGKQRFGEVLSLQEGPKILDPKRLHATEGWTGFRVVLTAYSVRSIEKLDNASKEAAASLGFMLPLPRGIADAPCGTPRLSPSANCKPSAAPPPSDLERRALAFGHRLTHRVCAVAPSGLSLLLFFPPLNLTVFLLRPSISSVDFRPAASSTLPSSPTFLLPSTLVRTGWISLLGSGVSEKAS